MDVDRLPAEVATAWRPQRPGRLGARNIPDALVEPDWGGVRVVAALTLDEAAMYREGEVVSVPEEILQALLDGFQAVNAVVEGHLTTAALRNGEGAFPEAEHVDRSPIVVPRVFRSNVKDDPYVRTAATTRSATEKAAPVTMGALATRRDARVRGDGPAVAGRAADRRRPPAGAQAPPRGDPVGVVLVRVSAFVRPSAVMTLASSASLGFDKLSYRAANSRYAAGEENDESAIVKAPDTPSRAPTPVPPTR